MTQSNAVLVEKKQKFESAYEVAARNGRLQLPRSRALGLWEAASSVVDLPGEFWECGVYRGGSAYLLARIIENDSRPLRLFDTFKGFADVGAIDGGVAYDGRMFYSENAVEDVRNFVGLESVSMHKGSIPDCFVGLEDSKIAFVNLDVDLYKPTREALRFVLPRMVEGGVIIVDDYGDPDWPGIASAVNDLGVGGFSLTLNDTQALLRP